MAKTRERRLIKKKQKNVGEQKLKKKENLRERGAETRRAKKQKKEKEAGERYLEGRGSESM